jgi:phosphoserine phosphatase
VKSALAGGYESIGAIIMATHTGMTTDEFSQIVTQWIATAKHPITRRPYTEMVYQPMLELLAYLRANDFKTFIVSGGSIGGGNSLRTLCAPHRGGAGMGL